MSSTAEPRTPNAKAIPVRRIPGFVLGGGRIRAIFSELAGILRIPLTRRVLALLLLFGISSFTILPNLGYPRRIIFDETYFIPAAQKYLNRVFFLEPHPPLGKLLIALGQHWLRPEQPANQFLNVEKIATDWPLDMDITGYRIMPALLGVLNPLLVFAILLLSLKRDLVALLGAGFVAFDNALIVEARAALLDSILIFFVLASILAFCALVVHRKKRAAVFIPLAIIAGAFCGAAANVKLTGLFILVLAGLYGLLLLAERRWRRGFSFGFSFAAGFAAVFLGLWAVHFAIAVNPLEGNDYGISETDSKILNGTYTPDPITRFVIQFQDGIRYQRNYEAGVPKLDLSKPDEIGSPWFNWIVGGRAIDYRWETDDGTAYRYVYLLGNPVTWLVSLLGIAFGSLLVILDLLFRFVPKDKRVWLYGGVALYWAYMIPIMAIERVMYLYHYFPPLVVGILLFAVVLMSIRRLSRMTRRDILVVAIILTIFAFWVYSPLTFYQPVTREQFQQRNVWPAWDLRCAGC